jgi:hypothetical protein
VGVHGRNDHQFQEIDYQVVRDAKLEAIKMLSHTDPTVFRRLRDENPDIEIITRLHGGGFGEGHHPTPEQFAAEMTPVMASLKPFCTMFQVHNEPNHVHRYEGWGNTDADAHDFNLWFLDVYGRLKRAHPWASLGFPGLAVPDPLHRDKAWLRICRPAIERADWLGCHCYWQTPPDRESVIFEEHSGLCFKYYHEMYPDKAIHILECGNSNGQGQGFSTDQQLYGDEYARWLQEVFKHPYIGSASFFILSSPDPTWESFSWRTDGGVKERIVGAVARLDRPTLRAIQAGAGAVAGAVGSAAPADQQKIGRIPPVYTNQNIIDAFYNAAGALGVGNWDILNKAGLDVNQLAQNRPSLYAGTPVDDLPNLTSEERALVRSELVKVLRKNKKRSVKVVAPAGLNLRQGAGADQAVIRLLPDQTPLDVLDDSQTWLFVATDEGEAGYVHRDYVSAPSPVAPPVVTSPPVVIAPGAPLALPGYLASAPDLAEAPLQPVETLTLGAEVGEGARRLAAIWNRLGGLLYVLAGRLQVDVGVALAVLAVESGGVGFSPNGRMVIRFENHLFYHNWGKHNPDFFNRHFTFSSAKSWEGHAFRPSPSLPFSEFHGDQVAEWRVLDFAASLDDVAAKLSISMGAPQILGSNHRRIGYASVQDMFSAFQSGERSQVLGLFDFIRADANMVQALRNRDYRAFAAGYNGPGQADTYATLIASWVQAFEALRPALTAAGVVFAPGATPPLDSALDAALAYLPAPTLPDILVQVTPGEGEEGKKGTQPVDPELQKLWIAHVKQGLDNNNVMFRRVLGAFMVPYYLTIALYVVQFLVGIGLFILAARLSVQQGSQMAALFFGGLGVVAFLAYFLSRPLRSLEENLQFITWLGVIYNTYWTRLLYMQNAATVHDELKDATQVAVDQIEELIDKNSRLASKRPGVR